MSWIFDIFIVLLYILHVYLFFYLKKKHKCLGFLAYLLFYCTSDFYVFFFFLFLVLVSDVALTSELGMSTPRPIEVDG